MVLKLTYAKARKDCRTEQKGTIAAPHVTPDRGISVLIVRKTCRIDNHGLVFLSAVIPVVYTALIDEFM